jgi:hypothetical protein
MKGVFYSRYGGSEVLEYGDLPEPKLSQNSVIVRVQAPSINPADIALQAGLGEFHGYLVSRRTGMGPRRQHRTRGRWRCGIPAGRLAKRGRQKGDGGS